tara:strand:- start:382 stop:996 length:615 start_codon:yes stop_codon:yes gene_type:complete
MTFERVCVACSYKTTDPSNWKRHCKGIKHLKRIQNNQENDKFKCKKCSFSCNHRNDFRKHRCSNIRFSDFIVDLVKQEKTLRERQEDIYDEIESIETNKEYKPRMKFCLTERKYITTYIHPKVISLNREDDQITDTLIDIQTKLGKYRQKLENITQPLLWKLITNKLKKTNKEETDNKIKISGVDNSSDNQIELEFDIDNWDTY